MPAQFFSFSFFYFSCLSDPAPTNQLATLSQDQPAKRARQTRDTLPSTRKRTRSQTESQQHRPLTQILDTVALNSQIVIQPTEQPTYSRPNKRIAHSQITSHNHHATQAFTQIITPPTQHINIINPITYQVHNNPTFEIADHGGHPAPSSQRRPQRKIRCKILDIPHEHSSLNLTPLRTTHIQQELWTYKKDKAFSMTPTEPSTHSPLMIWISCTQIIGGSSPPRKETEMIHPKDRNNTTLAMPLCILKD